MTSAPAVLPLPFEQDFELREEREEPRHSDGGRLTLGDMLTGVWEGLHAAGAAGCPVCGDRMQQGVAAGGCSGCGSTLS